MQNQNPAEQEQNVINIDQQEVENIMEEDSDEKQDFLKQSQEIILQQNGTEQVVFQRQETKHKLIQEQTFCLTRLLLYRTILQQFQFVVIFIIIVLIYKNAIRRFSWIFFTRAVTFFIYFIVDIVYYFKFRREILDYHKSFFILAILNFVDFFAYFILFIYLQTGALRIAIMVLIFIHLAANFILYFNKHRNYVSIYRSYIGSSIESLILIFFTFKIARYTRSYSWNESFIFFAIIAYTVLVISSIFIIGVVIFCLCLIFTPEGRLALFYEVKIFLMVLFFLFIAAQGIILFCFYFGFKKVCFEGWVNEEKNVDKISSYFLFRTSIAGIVIHSIIIVFIYFLVRRFANFIQQLIFKQDPNKVQKISLVNFQESMQLNAQKVSDNFFKSKKKRQNQEVQQLKEAQNLAECVICFDKKANCLQEPCGHIVACQECEIEIFKKNDRKCINCRKKIEKIYIIQKDDKNKQKFKIVGMLKIIQFLLQNFQAFKIKQQL